MIILASHLWITTDGMIECYVVTFSKRIEKEHLQHNIFSAKQQHIQFFELQICFGYT